MTENTVHHQENSDDQGPFIRRCGVASCASPSLLAKVWAAWVVAWVAEGDTEVAQEVRITGNRMTMLVWPLLPQPPLFTPHGGEYLTTKTNHYEIVYMPLQARIYLFDDKMKPLTARDIHAQMSLNPPQQNVPQKIPFQYVAKPAGVTEQDYVVAAFDFRQLPDTRNADHS